MYGKIISVIAGLVLASVAGGFGFFPGAIAGLIISGIPLAQLVIEVSREETRKTRKR